MKSPFLIVALLSLTLHAAAQDLPIYHNSLQNGWQSWSWATVNFGDTSALHDIPTEIRVSDTTSSSRALYLHHAPLNSALYSSLTFWLQPTRSSANQLQVLATINGETQTAIPLSFTAPTVNNWQHWQKFTFPLAALGVANSRGFDGIIIQNISGAPNTFYVGDISLIAIPPPNPVPLTVDAAAPIRTVDPRIYGMNIEVWDHFLTSPQTTSILTGLGIGAIRFPGGSASDGYHWAAPRGGSRWSINVTNFAAITATCAAQAFITANYGDGTPQEAAAWVAYYNGDPNSTTAIGTDSRGHDWKTAGYWAAIRAATPLPIDDGLNFLRMSHPAPFAFRYWEIGNECYGGWEKDVHGQQGSGLTGAPHDPATYATYFAQFYKAMLAVDPTIHIGAVVIPHENSTHPRPPRPGGNPNHHNPQRKEWTPTVLSTLKSLGVTPHFLIYHYYAQNPGAESDPGLLQSSDTIAPSAANLRKMATDYLGASGSSIELNITELNSVSSDPGKQSTSLVNALFYADAIGAIARTEFNTCTWWDLRNGAGRRANNSSGLYGWRDYGDYGIVSTGGPTPPDTPYPVYYAAKLLTHWARGGDTILSATTSYPLLSIHAARLKDGTLALLVINKHPTAPLPARITLNNFTPAPIAQLLTYGIPNDQSNSDITSATTQVPAPTFSQTFPPYSISVLLLKPK
jgi:hypothetical protein